MKQNQQKIYGESLMYKYNHVIFCKSYRGDLKRIKNLKSSIDKFNADKIPFVICCPDSDKELFYQELQTHQENYDFLIVTDEEVLSANNLSTDSIQTWKTQQVIKLGFYKLNLSRFYTIYDSDCYFISNFYTSDFMYTPDIPYTFMSCTIDPNSIYHKIKDFFNRTGPTYDFVHMSQTFSAEILNDMDKNLLTAKNLTFPDLIEICPYEFNWYGEYLIKCDLQKIIPAMPKVRTYFYQEDYILDRHRGIRVSDIISMGYNCICMQSGWLNRFIYKNPWYSKLARIKRNVFFKKHSGHKSDPVRLFILYFYKIPVWTIKEIFKN